jgi:peptidoglycan/LPS O-acetylase OafA/YrhL
MTAAPRPQEPLPAVREPAPEHNPARINHFTFLRLILASLVIVGHAAELSDGNTSRELFHRLGARLTAGDFAVDAFFVISGYLILQSWSQQPRLRVFLMKRILRIVPAFLVAYLISVLIVGRIGGGASYFAELSTPEGIFQLFRGMAVMTYPHLPPVFPGFPYPSSNGSIWTITYEFRCYLLIPLLASLGLCARRLTLVAAWLAITLGAGWHSATHPGDTMPLGLARFLPYFLAGSCAYLYRDKIGWGRTRGGVSMLAAALSVGSPAAITVVLPMAGSYAVLWLALSEWSPLGFFSPRDDLSYGVYLYGWPVQKLLLWYLAAAPLACQAVGTLSASLLLGWASWNLIEKRCLAWKASLVQRRVSPGAPAVAIVSGLTPPPR